MTEAGSAAFSLESDQRWRARWRWVAVAWLLIVLAVGAHQWRFWQHPPIDSDILAMLPRDASDVLLSDATEHIADASSRQLVVMLGAADAAKARAAATAFSASVQRDDARQPLPFQASGQAQDWFDQARALYAPHRDRLLTAEQREHLQQADVAALTESTLAALYGPMAAPRLTQWRQDPLGLWPQWWQARAAGSGVNIGEDGVIQAEGRYWIALPMEMRGSAFRLDGERIIDDALDRASRAARQVEPQLSVLRAGVPLHAEAAAVQANREINTIGWGSLAAVLLLVFLAFRSLRPILLVAGSLLIGCAAALSVTALVFGQVHLLTLIFGASLVGVAEDYGIHWFASRQGVSAEGRWRLLRHLLPGLWIALLTSALAYLALGLAPFPGLRQMALFSVVGLAAAFLTVICWFPWLDGGQVRSTRFSQAIGRSLEAWPRLRASRTTVVVSIALAVVVGLGLARVRSNDDLRSLQSSPPALMAQQIEVGRLLGMPSPAQFFLVRGDTAEQVLQREEALTARLRELQAEHRIGGYRAISDWLPSQRQQQTDAALTAQVESAVLAQLAQLMDEPLQRAEFAGRDLGLPEWLASPVSAPFRQLWLGKLGDEVASVVLIDDLGTPAGLTQVQAQADGLEGVRWVDRTADFTHLLRHYRHLMSALLVAGALLVFAVLWWRYRRIAWRVMVPTLLATVLTVAALGWLGQPLQLFNVLALTLLLGMGIDYGIFLAEHRGDPTAWMAVCIGAASTWLSFGLLGLSATPALRAFGLTLLLGIGLVWFISPFFRPAALPPSPDQENVKE